MSFLKFQASKFEIESINVSPLPQGLSSLEKSVIDLIMRWQNNDTVFALTTSGSTSAPKPISFTRNQLKSSAHLTIEALQLKRGSTSLICLETRYIAGQMMVIRSLENGMNIVAVEPCADPLEKISQEEKIDFAAFVPYQLQAILQSMSSTAKLDKINSVIVGGAPLDESTIQKLQSLNCNVYATYGMTETISHIALQKLNGFDKQDYFKAIKGVTLSLDHRNCLVIGAPHLAEKVITNDLVELFDHNKFRWLGRADNVVNTGGVKINPEKVEREISITFGELHIRSRFFIYGMDDPKLGSRLVLIIEGEALPKKPILDCLSKRLSKYEVPKEVYFIPHFIETATQKVNRGATFKLCV